MRPVHILFGAATLLAPTLPLYAQVRTPEPRRETITRVLRFGGDDDANRAALGIGTGSSGARDTLGLLIERVTPGGPADKAGLQEGYRITAVDGVNLRLSPSDAGDPAMEGLMTRRLVRALGKVKPGDDVDLTVYADGATRRVKVKTESMSDLEGMRPPRLSEQEAADRPVLGLGFGGGSVRDTLGLLVTAITAGGPAEKAGLEEGNRIRSIDGVDVRVPASEAAGGRLVMAKVRRFSDAVAKHKAGDDVQLEVYADGAVKKVAVKTARAADVYHDRGPGAWGMFFGGEGMAPIPPVPPMPPMAPMPEAAPQFYPSPELEYRLDRLRNEVLPRVREQMRLQTREMTRAMEEAGRAREMARVSAERAARVAPVLLAASDAGRWSKPGATVVLMGSGDDLGIAVPGLRLAPVTPDLASYFGAGSERGLLVLESRAPWEVLHAGDVILSVNGHAVRDGERTSIDLDEHAPADVTVLRKGKTITVHRAP